MFKSLLLLVFTLSIVPQIYNAQIDLRIPKLPEAERSPEQKQESAKANASRSDRNTNNDQPTIAKDSVQIRAFTFSSYRKDSSIWSWVPEMKFEVNGPIESGSQLVVEFVIPGTGAWITMNCKTDQVRAGFRSRTECGGRQIPEEKGSIYTGAVSFSIKMKNELMGTNLTLFSGTMKIAKTRSNATAAGTEKHFVYYVDHDWNLPIGYVFYEYDESYDRDDPRRTAKPVFNIAFWQRGEQEGFAEPYLFFGGKQVGQAFYNGREVSKPNCSETEVENNPTHITALAGKFKWKRVKCRFYSVIPWNRSSDKNETMFGRLHLFSENPGEYEVKIMQSGRLIRTFKFSADRNGQLVDNGLASKFNLGSDRLIVPVQVLGDQDGAWDKMAWKTDSFYGNPIPGFSIQ